MISDKASMSEHLSGHKTAENVTINQENVIESNQRIPAYLKSLNVEFDV